MKKVYFLSALALTLVFASCTMEKRHHRNGFYISWNHKAPKSEEKTTINANEEKAVLAAIAEAESGESAVASTTNTADVTTAATVNPTQALSPAQSVAPAAITCTPAQETVTANETKITQTNPAQHNSEKQNSAQPDEVLLIILAILLPPLAMYLYEGSTWTSRCTLNLILTLLCGLPGVIHALIVILGKK